MQLTRRRFLRWAGAASAGFLGLQQVVSQMGCGNPQTPTPNPTAGFGPLSEDPEGVLDLPEGFTYTVFSRMGEPMDDGLLVPGAHDGMATFRGSNGRTIIVRNHELNPSAPEVGGYGDSNELLKNLDATKLFDAGFGAHPNLGGTTTLVYNTREQTLETQFRSLAGTARNCAGGRTPWNTWITCEETVQTANEEFETAHGYNFETSATETPDLIRATPLRAMGRFNHEAVAVDPNTGIVYQTEDRGDGLIYRFVPNVKGKLLEGGRLEALVIKGMSSAKTQNWDGEIVAEPRQAMDVEWLPLEHVEPEEDELRHRGFDAGAAQFARGEGIWRGDKSFYFACTNGGPWKKGQIWEYAPSVAEATPDEANSPGKLRLFAQPPEGDICTNADNLTVTPWGDLIVCEDRGDSHLIGITPEGELYVFGHNVMNESETAGACFSPDGSTLFVNIQRPGLTLAITGPWDRRAA